MKIDGQCIEKVSKFKYLGSLISEDGYCQSKIHRKTAMVKKIFMDTKRLSQEN